MRTQSLLILLLIFIVLTVMGIIIFLPSSPPNPAELTSPSAIAADAQKTPGNTSLASEKNGDAAKRPGESNPISTANIPGQTNGGDALSQSNPNQSPVISATDALVNPPAQNAAAQSSTAPGVISGKVRSSQGKPLEGAAVQIEGQSVVLSNTQGDFRFDGVAQPKVTITAQLAGFQAAKRDNVSSGTTNLELVMVQEGAIAGRVLDQFGDSIALAKVQSKALQGIWAVEINADAEGRFLLTEAPQTRIRLQATQDGFTDSGAGVVEVDSPSNEEAILRLDRPTFTISGHVKIEETQQGIGGFKLKAVLQDAGQDEQTVETDGLGLYKFNNLRQGTYVVSSMARENSQLNYVIPLKNDFKSVRIYEGNANNVDFFAVPGRTVSGVVVNSNQQPVSGAEVTVAGLQSVQTVSNFNGQYRLTGVPVTGGQTQDRLSIRLQASHSDYGTGFSETLPVDTQNEITGVTITLKGKTNLSGKTIDRNGNPVGDVSITLIDLALGQTQETRSTASGDFSFTQVATSQETLTTFGGTHQIKAEKENYCSVTEQIVLQAGQAQNINITLDGGGAIQGRVLDSNNQPLAGVSVTAQLTRGGLAQTASDPYGLYILSGLPGGSYDIHFRVNSDPPLTGVLYQVASGSSGADVTLSLGKWDLMGTVLDSQTGQRIYQYMLSIEGEPKDPRGQSFVMNRQVNTPDGTYHVTLTEPGIYRVRFLATGYHPLEEKADIALNTLRVQYINPQLKPLVTTGQIQGTFAAPEGMALAGINIPGVQAFPVSGNTFMLEGVPAGNHDLIFHVYEQSSGSVFELGVLLNVAVLENQTTNLGQITTQNLLTRSRNF